MKAITDVLSNTSSFSASEKNCKRQMMKETSLNGKAGGFS